MTTPGTTAIVQVTLARPAWVPSAVALLDDVERARLERLRRPVDRDAYLTRHALARLTLGRLLAREPGELRFTRDCPTCAQQHGKPRLGGDSRPLAFSLSGTTSSGSPDTSLVAVAVVTDLLPRHVGGDAGGDVGGNVGSDIGHDVGVDLESIAATAFAGFDDVALHDLERAELDAMPTQGRPAVRAAWWSRKEAVVKALGDGLRTEPATIATTPPGATRPRLLEPHRWPRLALADLPLQPCPPGIVGAVCVLGVDDVRVVIERADLAHDVAHPA